MSDPSPSGSGGSGDVPRPSTFSTRAAATSPTPPPPWSSLSAPASLPADVWSHALSYLDARDLSTAGAVNRALFSLSSNDVLWRRLCDVRWEGKQMARSRFGCDFGPGPAHDHDHDHDHDHNDHNDHDDSDDNARLVRPRPRARARRRTAREAYRLAECDSRRKQISSASEFASYRWLLVYNGVPSGYGLRHFRSDGTYRSPYLGGVCPWSIERGCLHFSGLRLPIERIEENWGWVAGRGTSTAYYSVEVDEETGQVVSGALID